MMEIRNLQDYGEERGPVIWTRDAAGVRITKEGAQILKWSGSYWIDADRIDTPEKVAVWADHLSQKTWMTRQSIRDFLMVSLSGLDVDWDV